MVRAWRAKAAATLVATVLLAGGAEARSITWARTGDALSLSWAVTSDSSAWEVKLRQGVGVPVSPDNVVHMKFVAPKK
jgi:hypothetical protein